MSDLKERLESLGLGEYYENFASEGFDTWETTLDITESDLTHLKVKLGHRRKLQRAIFDARSQNPKQTLPISIPKLPSNESSYRSDESGLEDKTKGDKQGASQPTQAPKRKYRRHPKPDEHAPERPPSAYVIFSNQTREELKGQDFSFTEIAKIVGERWQVLSSDAREACERQANAAKEKYYSELAEYKKTKQYADYQKYLKDFKAKHGHGQNDGKRTKLESESCAPSRGSNRDQLDNKPANQEGPRTRQRVAETNSSYNGRLPGQNYSQSPSGYTFSNANSPQFQTDGYSPHTTSPKPGAKDRTYDRIAPQAVDRMRNDAPPPSLIPHMSRPSMSPVSSPLALRKLSSDPASRRTIRESPSGVPSLTHEDTTLSSDTNTSQSQPGGANYPAPPSISSLVDAATAHQRTLPMPVPSINPTPSPLDSRPLHSPAVASAMPTPYYAQDNSKLDALLRAGELARDADNPHSVYNGKDPPA